MTGAGAHVAVLMGGWSPEREVSLVSGEACAVVLEKSGYRVSRVDVGRDIAAELTTLKPDVAFNALHGRWGEDGCVQGLLEILEIPYTHSGVLASALAMDKEVAKRAFRDAGLPVAESRVVTREEAAASHPMEPPYVIKPVNQGSSVGIFIVRPGDNRPPEELKSKDWSLGDEVMVEHYVAGKELTSAIKGERSLGVTEILPSTEFYDYAAKYEKEGSRHVVPAELDPDTYAQLEDIALRAHQVLGCRGVSRTDFRYDEAAGELALLEVNTQPGMTATSLVPELAVHAGISFEELVQWILEDASCQR